ncbi:MAG: hydrogenase-3 subunit E [Firmicutes bacterium]|nr:hydrogenase-3 subunit E [Bacillota bacterium]
MAAITRKDVQQQLTIRNPEQWVDEIVHRRRQAEFLLLDAEPAGPVAVLGSPESGLATVKLDLTHQPFPWRIPSLVDRGVGEAWWAEMVTRQAVPSIEWHRLPSAHDIVYGKGVFRFPLGPVRGDVTESLSIQLSVMGDEIIQVHLVNGLKQRQMRRQALGLTPAEAVRVIERWTGTSTVAHSLAFSLAVEDALGLVSSNPRADMMRSILAELERVHSHLADLASLCAATGLPVAQMDYLRWREEALRLNFRLTGHRYLRGRVSPGGLSGIEWPQSLDFRAVQDHVIRLLEGSQEIAERLSRTPSFLDRLHGAGRIPPPTINYVRPVGPVGRASGLAGDVREWWPYAAYGRDRFTVPQQRTADAYARFWVRTCELAESLSLLRRWVNGLGETLWQPPPGEPTLSSLRSPGGGQREGIGMVEAPRGCLVYRVVLEGAEARLAHLGVATPSSRNWYAFPPAVANHNILQDFPIIEASFGLSVSGWDG